MYGRCSVVIIFCFFFFFKQKTAYEMRISDWSSDVCSSDLAILPLYSTRFAVNWTWLFPRAGANSDRRVLLRQFGEMTLFTLRGLSAMPGTTDTLFKRCQPPQMGHLPYSTPAKPSPLPSRPPRPPPSTPPSPSPTPTPPTPPPHP